MSQRERQTQDMAHRRTQADYLVIISENPDANFGEYDNLPVLWSMVKSGLIVWREDKHSRATSMFTSLWPALTDAGRAALRDAEEGGE